MTSKKIAFRGSENNRLAGYLDLPEGEPVAYALFAHCFTCTKNLKSVSYLSRALRREGVAVMRFDFSGLGESEGDFAKTNVSSNVADLLAAAAFLAAGYRAPEVLIGHSLGGAAVLQAAAGIPSARLVATIGTPADPGHVKRHLRGKLDEIEARGEAVVDLAGRPFMIKKQFLEDLDRNRMETAIKNLNRALIIFHAPLDDTVGIDNAGRIFQAARHPKSFVALDKGDHLLMNEKDAGYVGSVIAAWVRRYVAAKDGYAD